MNFVKLLVTSVLKTLLVKVKEKVLLDHTYVASCNADVNKKKKRRIKSRSAKYAFQCVEDH